MGHDRSWSELELAQLLVEDADTGDVGRKQVGGELQALKSAAQRARQGFGQGGLAKAGDILQQNVALAEQGHEQELDGRLLADDDPADIFL